MGGFLLYEWVGGLLYDLVVVGLMFGWFYGVNIFMNKWADILVNRLMDEYVFLKLVSKSRVLKRKSEF